MWTAHLSGSFLRAYLDDRARRASPLSFLLTTAPARNRDDSLYSSDLEPTIRRDPQWMKKPNERSIKRHTSSSRASKSKHHHAPLSKHLQWNSRNLKTTRPNQSQPHRHPPS